MSINTAKYFGPVAPVRYLMSDLRIVGASERDYLYPLLCTYAARCEEKLECHVQPKTGDIVFEMSERAQKAFAQSVQKFSERFAPTIRSWGVRSPSGIANMFGCFLEAGNYPADSPYVIRRNLMERFNIFSEVFASHAEEIATNTPEDIVRFQRAHEETEKIKNELDESRFEDDEQVALSRIADLLDSRAGEIKKMGMSLIVLRALTSGDSSSLPSFLMGMAEVSRGFNPLQWRSTLAHGFGSMVLKRSIYDTEWEWEDALEGAVIEAGRGRPFVYRSKYDLSDGLDERVIRVYKSLLVLLSKGEIDLAQRFTKGIDDWGVPSGIVESLIHISALIELDDVRLSLIDRALLISESNDQNGYMERPLADHIAAFFSYQEDNPELEHNLLRLVDRLSYRRILIDGYHSESEDEFVTFFIKAVLDMYDGLITQGLIQSERKREVSESVVAKTLELAASQNLNHIRRFLLRSALEETRNVGGKSSWNYLEPMMRPEEQERIDSTDQSPFEYWYDFLNRKKKSEPQGGRGGAAPSGTPSVQGGLNSSGMGASSNAVSPNVLNQGVFPNTMQSSAVLFAGSPVINAANLTTLGTLSVYL